MSHHQDKPKRLVCKIQLTIMLRDQTHSKVNKVLLYWYLGLLKLKEKMNEKKEKRKNLPIPKPK